MYTIQYFLRLYSLTRILIIKFSLFTQDVSKNHVIELITFFSLKWLLHKLIFIRDGNSTTLLLTGKLKNFHLWISFKYSLEKISKWMNERCHSFQISKGHSFMDLCFHIRWQIMIKAFDITKVHKNYYD